MDEVLEPEMDFSEQIDTNVVFNGANEFQVMGNYLFVTSNTNKDDPKSLDLFISMHGETFVKAKFEGVEEHNLTIADFHIVDVTDDGEVLKHLPSLIDNRACNLNC